MIWDAYKENNLNYIGINFFLNKLIKLNNYYYYFVNIKINSISIFLFNSQENIQHLNSLIAVGSLYNVVQYKEKELINNNKYL